MTCLRKIGAAVLVTFVVGCQQGLYGPLGQNCSGGCPVVPLRGGVGNKDWTDSEVVRITRLLKATEKGVIGWQEGRLDVQDSVMMRTALLIDLAAIDVSRRKDLLEEAEEMLAWCVMSMMGTVRWDIYAWVIQLGARADEIGGKPDIALRRYQDALEVLDEAVREIELRESAVPGYDGAAYRLRVRMVRDLVCARMASVAK